MFETIKNLLKGMGILAIMAFAAMILAVVIYIVWIVLKIAVVIGLELAIYMVGCGLAAIALFIAAGCCNE